MKKIIFAGKGGAGKTTIFSLVLTSLLNDNPRLKILTIDADPSYNLLKSFEQKQPDIVPLGEQNDLLPEDWGNIESEFFEKIKKESIKKINIGGCPIEYSFLGHHQNNSCLCAYNNSLNYLLRHIDILGQYDYVFIDREAGLEHINRSVYGSTDDMLIVVSHPTNEYLAVAKEIMELADMIGSTKNRLIIINNSLGYEYSSSEIEGVLNEAGLMDYKYIDFPKINTMKGLQKLSADKILEQLTQDQIGIVKKIVNNITNENYKS